MSVDWTKPIQLKSKSKEKRVVLAETGQFVVIGDGMGWETVVAKSSKASISNADYYENIPEKPKIRPRAGELWKSPARFNVFIIQDSQGLRRIFGDGSTHDGDSSSHKNWADMIHGENGWLRVYPPVEEASDV
jgi:hypothetical protein